MTVTGLLDWLVVRQGLTRRIYGAADAGLSISNATYLSRCPSETTVVSDSVYERSGMRVHGIRVNCSGNLKGPTHRVGHPVAWRLLMYGEV